MDIVKWKNNINKLTINQNIKSNIIKLFTEFSKDNVHLFIPITDKKLIKAFNNVNNYKPLTICLDIEFQSAISNHKKYITTNKIKNDSTAVFIRELGFLVFINDKSSLYYIGHIFLNFKQLIEFKGTNFHNTDIRLIGSKYATVTDNTYDQLNKLEKAFHIEYILEPLEKLKNLENIKEITNKVSKELYNNYLFKNILSQKIKDNIKTSFSYLIEATNTNKVNEELNYIKRQLHNIQYDIYAKYLDKETLKNFNKTNELYWNDKMVKERLKLIHNKYDEFMELFKVLSLDSVLVVKGKMDLIALKNMYTLIFPNSNINHDLPLEHYYDIETFNGFSKTHYGSSQLENTYKGLIKSKKYKGSAKKLFDQIMLTVGDKAHNPVTDSLFTIVVAVLINLGLNEHFANQNGGSNNEYYHNYLKYKNRYLEIKNIN